MQTNYTEVWEEICFILSENVNAGMAENVYEQRVIIQTQKSLTIGRKGTIRPDIVLLGSNRKALVAIEVKRPSEKLASLEQLKSYMRQMKADFGLLVGHEVRIYYDGILNPNPEPLQLSKVSFNPVSSDGHQFVEPFTKANFLQEKYKPFLSRKISQFNLKREAAKLKEEICKPETKSKMIDFLKSEYSETSQDIVSEALKNLKIDIYYDDKPSKTTPVTRRPQRQPHPQPTPPEEPKYLLTCKNKASGECFIYIEESGLKPQVIAPNGRFIPFDEDRFYPPQDEEKIEELLTSGKINEDQLNKYKTYLESQRRRTKRITVKGGSSPISFPYNIPKKTIPHSGNDLRSKRKRVEPCTSNQSCGRKMWHDYADYP